SKKFKIPQEEITEFNPDLKAGVKPKMKLWIPAGSGIKKEEKKVEAKEKEFCPQNETYEVAMILSLNIPKNISSDPSLVDSIVVTENMDKETIANLEFY